VAIPLRLKTAQEDDSVFEGLQQQKEEVITDDREKYRVYLEEEE